MASQYVLARRDYFNSLLGRSDNNSQAKQIITPHVNAVVEPLPLSPNKIKESVDEIVGLLPKTYRSRASALLRMIESKLKMGEMGMLIMKHDGQEYENLYDLLFWLFTSTNIVRVQRPTNAFDFVRTLVELKIPQRLLSTKEAYVRKVQRSISKYKRKIN